MNEIIGTVATVIGTLGGWEMIKFLINRKTNARKAEAEADRSEFNVLRETMEFLQEQLRNKEQRFAEQTDIVRKLNTENLELSKRVAQLETERSLKLCERRNCKDREPQSGY